MKNKKIEQSIIDNFLNIVSNKLNNLPYFYNTIFLKIKLDYDDDDDNERYDFLHIDIKNHLIEKHSFPKDIEVKFICSNSEKDFEEFNIEISNFLKEID